ncbi:RebB like protein [Rhodobacteraceae bacterium RKSG542]|uniref:RebB family R body protein n=1 Tax=Pseudovibrio flavus TaxID=2529854 RepID=UPI0012BBA7BB|nr:RebB family R body protein [Pseudovibrio flavus]MTI19201.1 RebB like protein [Pseudovibrio flavus]
MADDTVNAQITDAVTQTNVKVVAEAPAQAMASLYQVVSSATGLSVQNATHSQQAMNQVTTAVVSKGVQLIMEIGSKS